MVRTFLIVLPLGLSFMVPLSLWIYYQRKHQPAPAASQYAAMLRKDLDAGDFTRYARILSEDIGERSLSKPDNLDAAASFIESTMGYDNMGYAVQRQVFEAQGRSLVNLVAELPGKSKPDKVVLVFAGYDDPAAAGVSAMMCVAHALAGSTHARTIRFAAVVNEADGGAVAKRSSESTNALHKIIQVEAFPGASKELGENRLFQTFPVPAGGPEKEVLERLQALQKFIEEVADAP